MLALVDISVKELTNVTPSANDFALIVNFGGTIEDIITFPKEEGQAWESETDTYMAVIADVHTDPNTNTCLEVGVGHPLDILVIAPVGGVPTLTKGSVFSYHEFTRNLSDGRLTDEEWQAMQSGKAAQDMPVWTESFLEGASSTGQAVYPFHANPGSVTSVDETPVPAQFNLDQNVPNPFNPSPLISFVLEKDTLVKLAVYNLNGQLVEVLIDRYLPAGQHSFTWTPKGLASGVYFVRLFSGTHIHTIRAVYLK